MYNFCTLFDSNYLHFGLSLYESLQNQCENFHLYIFAFDKKSEEFLQKLNLQKATIISLEQFEDQQLLSVKHNRTMGEYCWTSTPSTILYVLKKFNVESCTYVDADIYFFDNPTSLIFEMQEKSVSIISHRYPAHSDQSAQSGKYCVQFMTFKNNKDGLEVLNWWRDRCLEWCYNRVEDGKFGDQKYLDDWLQRFSCVYEIENFGAGIAPWNIEKYDFTCKNKKIIAIEKYSKMESKLIFYHFHGFKLLSQDIMQLMPKRYKLNKNLVKFIYSIYIDSIERNIRIAQNYSSYLQEIKNKKTDFFAILKLKLFPLRKNLYLRK